MPYINLDLHILERVGGLKFFFLFKVCFEVSFLLTLKWSKSIHMIILRQTSYNERPQKRGLDCEIL